MILTLLGLSLLSMTLIPVTSTEEVINFSFTVSAGDKYGPYDNGTTCHTRVLGKSVLQGEITVVGEGIYLTASGYNAYQIKDLYITDTYSFVIDPADDLYTFTFNNTGGRNESSVHFKLKEIWTRSMMFGAPPLFIAWLAGFLILPIGIAIITAASSKSRSFAMRPKVETS